MRTYLEERQVKQPQGKSAGSTFKNPPGYSVTYGTPPFTQDGSGDPVAVKGTAFATVSMQPAYGYDFENGTDGWRDVRFEHYQVPVKWTT